MRILTYSSADTSKEGWHFQKVAFRSLNLIVGATASGKTRFLQSIFNIGAFAVRENNFVSGSWDIVFENDGNKYNWVVSSNDDAKQIEKEYLYKLSDNDKKVIIERDSNGFSFNGISLPKLAKNQSAIYLLKDEDIMKPVFAGFTKITRRQFFSDELTKQSKPQIVTDIIDRIKINTQREISIDLSVNVRLYLLKKHFYETYKKICKDIIDIFPFIDEIAIKDIHDFNPLFPEVARMPIVCIKERNVNQWLRCDELSSGIQKVILMLTDLETMPPNSIYLVDEYENSLGVNAINFFPPLLIDYKDEFQFIITSHHPHLINNIPIDNWYIMHRKGTDVKIIYGEELYKRYGKSTQKHFINLVNDPLYKDGIE